MDESCCEQKCQSKPDDHVGSQDEKHHQDIDHHHKMLSVPRVMSMMLVFSMFSITCVVL